MLKKLSKCNKCNLCNNQKPLLDKVFECDVMWVGLSAKKVDDVNETIPLCNDTNSGKIIEMIENKLSNIRFYKSNLVKCLPLDENNKLRYPSTSEMNACIDNLLLEIKKLNPKIIFVLGKNTYNFIDKYFKKNKIDNSKLIYIEHPSYIYVYKRKYIDDYVDKIVNICSEII
jgi:DNA polymerase